MAEKTLLDILKEEKKKEAIKEEESEREESQKELSPKEEPKEEPKERSKEKPKEKTINIFSAASFKHKTMQEEEEKEITKMESKVSSVIETPNYDLTETLSEEEHKKIFVIEKDAQKTKKGPNKFKCILLSILFAIFGVWGIINVAQIDNVAGQIAEVTSQYNINLFNYLKNLYTLDATNSENMKNLFETIPEDEAPATNINEKSNWFDRFCNFIGGIFGG